MICIYPSAFAGGYFLTNEEKIVAFGKCAKSLQTYLLKCVDKHGMICYNIFALVKDLISSFREQDRKSIIIYQIGVLRNE